MAALFTPNYPYYDGNPRLLSTPERTAASPNYTGRGVVIAFIDSGFYPHPDLTGRILVHADATTNRIVESKRFDKFEDLSWHGQMTSVIAAGDGRTSDGLYRGIACDSQLVLIKVSNRRGRIKESDILRGLHWLIENFQGYNVKLLNLSVGGDAPTDDPTHPIYEAIRALTAGGVTVLAAAGNSGTSHLVPPASSVEAITVGGFDDQNTRRTAFWQDYPNNWGVAYTGTRKPDLTAPARWIASPILPNSSVEREAHWLGPLLDINDRKSVDAVLKQAFTDLSISRAEAFQPSDAVYMMLQERIAAHKLIDAHHQHVDGTSVSVAIATSVAAQLLEANRTLTPKSIKAILTSTARRISGVPAERQGYGVIDASLAVSTAALAAQMRS